MEPPTCNATLVFANDTPSGSRSWSTPTPGSIIATIAAQACFTRRCRGVSPDGSRVYVVDGVARTVQVVGTDTNTVIDHPDVARSTVAWPSTPTGRASTSPERRCR